MHFPYTPDPIKHRMVNWLLEIDVYHPFFIRDSDPYIKLNRSTEFVRFLRFVRTKTGCYRPFNHREKDMETMMNIYWSIQDESLSYRTIRAFVLFKHRSDEHVVIWNVAMNILFAPTCDDDILAAVTLLESYIRPPPPSAPPPHPLTEDSQQQQQQQQSRQIDMEISAPNIAPIALDHIDEPPLSQPFFYESSTTCVVSFTEV